MDDISNNAELAKELYKTQNDFYREEVDYHDISKPEVTQSCRIKKLLHQILTNAIFHYCPCSDLLNLCKRQKPSAEKWGEDTNKWLSLSVEPYQFVSDHILKYFINYFCLTQMLNCEETKNRQ